MFVLWMWSTIEIILFIDFLIYIVNKVLKDVNQQEERS